MADIAAFITARLDEEKRGADFIIGDDGSVLPAIADASKTIRRVSALRAIVAAHSTVCVKTVEKYGEVVAWYYAETDPCPDLRHLASIWADHPDYNEDWRS